MDDTNNILKRLHHPPQPILFLTREHGVVTVTSPHDYHKKNILIFLEKVYKNTKNTHGKRTCRSAQLVELFRGEKTTFKTN